MPGYDMAHTHCYNWDEFNFGGAAGTKTLKIQGPPGKVGRIVDMGCVVSVATVFATTTAKINVGITSALTSYASINIPTAKAADAVLNVSNIVANSGTITTRDLPADTPVTLSFVEGTGANLAGKACPFITIGWY